MALSKRSRESSMGDMPVHTPKRSKLTKDYVWNTGREEKMMLSDLQDTDWKRTRQDRFLSNLTVDELEQLEEAIDAPSGFDFLTLWKDVDHYLKMEDDCVMLLVCVGNDGKRKYCNAYKSGQYTEEPRLVLNRYYSCPIGAYETIQKELDWAKDTKIYTVSAAAYPTLDEVPIAVPSEYLKEYYDTTYVGVNWFVLPLRVVKEYLVKHCCKIYTEMTGKKYSTVVCKHRDERVGHICIGRESIFMPCIKPDKKSVISYLCSIYPISEECADCLLYEMCKDADSVGMFGSNGEQWKAQHNYMIRYMWLNGEPATKHVMESIQDNVFKIKINLGFT